MAALIVMEFLITGFDVTEEISQSIGVTKPSENVSMAKFHDFGEDEVYVILMSDYQFCMIYNERICFFFYSIEGDADNEVPGDEIDDSPEISKQDSDDANAIKPRISWLLQVAFEYFGVNNCEYLVCVHFDCISVQFLIGKYVFSFF